MLALRGEIDDRGGAVVVATPMDSAAPIEGGGFTVRAGGESPAELTCRLLVTAPRPLGAGRRGAHRRISTGHDSEAPSRQGRLLPPDRTRAVRTPDLSAADPRRARHPLSQGPRRPGGVRAGSGLCRDRGLHGGTPRAPPASTPISGASGPAYPTAPSRPTTPASGPSCTAPASRSRTSRSTGPRCTALPGLIALFGIESPGLTSSLAIGEEVATRLAAAS